MSDRLDLQPDLAIRDGDRPMNDPQIVPMSQTAPLARVQPSQRSDLASLLEAAKGGIPAETIKTLVELCHVEADRRARQEFNEAFARFKIACPPVIRLTTNANPKMSRVNREGVKVLTQYASLEDIAFVVDGPLLAEGLTGNWCDAAVTPDGLLTRSFILHHVGGYSSPPSVSPPIPVEGTAAWRTSAGERGDTSASPAQRYMIADTTAKRAAMIAGLGLPMYYDDSDAAIEAASLNTITEEQARSLNDLIIETGTDYARFFAFYAARSKTTIAKLADLPASQFEHAIRQLEAKRAKK